MAAAGIPHQLDDKHGAAHGMSLASDEGPRARARAQVEHRDVAAPKSKSQTKGRRARLERFSKVFSTRTLVTTH